MWPMISGLMKDEIMNLKKYTDIQGVPGGKDLTSGECSLGQTITI